MEEWKLIENISLQMNHWPVVKRLEHTIGFTALQAVSRERDESDTVTAMAGLSMQSMHRWVEDLNYHFKRILLKK